jgi:predicted nucleic acid-binding protein
MNQIKWERKYYLDASAAVKLVIDERGSAEIRSYFKERGDQGFEFYMTSLCFVEALSALKTKWEKNELNKEDYVGACGQLIALLAISDLQLDELSLTDLDIYLKTKQIVREYDIDFSDALQVVTVKHGRWSLLSGESQSLLITADGPLARAARGEGLVVWDCLREPPPS